MNEKTFIEKVNRTKRLLQAHAKKSGISENFGQKEFRKLYDEALKSSFDTDIVFQFREWANNFDIE